MGEAEGCQLRLLWKVHVCGRENPRDRLAAGSDRLRVRSRRRRDAPCRRPELRHARVRRPHARPAGSTPGASACSDLVALAADPPAGLEPGGSARAVVRDRRARAPLGRRRASCIRTSTTATAAGSRSGARRSTRPCRRRSPRSRGAAAGRRRRVRRRPRRDRARPLPGASSTRSRATGFAPIASASSAVLPRRPSALELFVDGLAAGESVLPPHSGYAALKRQLSRWVYDGLGALARGSAAAWKLSLRLDERTVGERDGARPRAVAAGGGRPDARPARVARVGRRRRDLRVPARERSAEGLHPAARRDRAAARRARHRVRRRRADGGELDVDTAGVFLREAMPQLEELGVPVLLPRAWVRSPSRLRVNLTATSRRPDRALERAALDGGADALRLAARGRRRRR